jgi:putative tricarboxylic transport membrane protein
MSNYRKTELALSVFILLLGVAVVVGAGRIEELEVLRDRVGARGFAYVIGTLLAIGGLVLLAAQIRILLAQGGFPTGPEDTSITGDDSRFPASGVRAFVVFLATLAYALLISPLGYPVATLIFLSAGAYLMGARGWGRLVIFPLAYSVGTYLLFDTVLGVRIPEGILVPLLDPIGLV